MGLAKLILLFGGSAVSVAAPSWKASVATVASLPSVGNTAGDARVSLDTNAVYVWGSDNAWYETPAGFAPLASPTFTGNVVLPTTTKVGNYVLAPTEYDSGNSGSTKTLDLSNGSAQKSTLSASCTFTLSNPVTGGAYILKLVQGSGGSKLVTWPATVKWPGGTAPTLSTGAGAIDLINLYWDGTSYYGTSAIGLA